MTKAGNPGIQSGANDKKIYGIELPNTNGVYLTFLAGADVYDGLKDELGLTDMSNATDAKYSFPVTNQTSYNIWVKLKLVQSSAGTDGKKSTKIKYLRCNPKNGDTVLPLIQAKETITGLTGWNVAGATFCSHKGG